MPKLERFAEPIPKYGTTNTQKKQYQKSIKGQRAKPKTTDPLKALTINISKQLISKNTQLQTSEILPLIKGAVLVIAEKNAIKLSTKSDTNTIEKWISLARKEIFQYKNASFSLFK